MSAAPFRLRCTLLYCVHASPPTTNIIADPFVELEGVARVREALHAHMWPILKMKVNPPPPSEAQSAGIPADNDVAAEEPSVQQIVGWCCAHPSFFWCVAFSFGFGTGGLLADAKPGLPDAKEGAGVQEQEEAVESFEELFSRFAAMKGTIGHHMTPGVSSLLPLPFFLVLCSSCAEPVK